MAVIAGACQALLPDSPDHFSLSTVLRFKSIITTVLWNLLKTKLIMSLEKILYSLCDRLCYRTYITSRLIS